jgi:hypothetical protein
MAEPVYQAGRIKRRRRTKAQMAVFDAQIIEILREDNPQSVRHVFYRLTDPRLAEPVEKSERGYEQVQQRLAKLRREGVIPYGWLSDATRRGYHVATYENEAEFIRSMAGRFRADVWKNAEVYCEVWCESRSIAGVIQDTCERLAVSLYPSGGFSSMTLTYEAAQSINWWAKGRKAVIFYIGDYDPAGVLIDRDIHRKLLEHVSPDIEIVFRRLAVTEEQIAAWDLPTKPRKASETRVRYITETVEAEAIPANTLRELLRTEIEKLLPPDALLVAKMEEDSAREYLEIFADTMGEYIGENGPWKR